MLFLTCQVHVITFSPVVNAHFNCEINHVIFIMGIHNELYHSSKPARSGQRGTSAQAACDKFMQPLSQTISKETLWLIVWL